MKRILLAVLLLSGLMASGQSVGRLRYDTTILEKVGGSNELKIKNNTRDSVGGIFTNVGGGWGRWLKPRTNFDTLFIGLDTVIVGSSPVNIYNADGILTGDRTLTGNNGLYSMLWDSMKLVNFNVWSTVAGDKGEVNLQNTLASLGWATDNLDRSAYLYADAFGAKLQAYDLSESKEINLLVDKDSIYTTYSQGAPNIASIGDDRIVTRSPGGGLRYLPSSAISQGVQAQITADNEITDPAAAVVNSSSNTTGVFTESQGIGGTYKGVRTLGYNGNNYFSSDAAGNNIAGWVSVNAPQTLFGATSKYWQSHLYSYLNATKWINIGVDTNNVVWNADTLIGTGRFWQRGQARFGRILNTTVSNSSDYVAYFSRNTTASSANVFAIYVGPDSVNAPSNVVDMGFGSMNQAAVGLFTLAGDYQASWHWNGGMNVGRGYARNAGYVTPQTNGLTVQGEVRLDTIVRMNDLPTGDTTTYKPIGIDASGYLGQVSPGWPAGGGGGMTNPMTTAGDIIYGGASGTPTRLPIGALGTNVIVDPTGALLYDVKSSGPNTYYYFNDFVNTVGTSVDGNGVVANNSSGTSTVSQPDANNHPGTLALSTSTGATNSAGVNTGLNSMSFGGGSWEMSTGQRSPATASDGTDTYQVLIGFFDVGTLNQTDGVYFLYDSQGVSTGSAASANWQIVTASNSTRTFTTTSTAVGTSTYSTLKITVNAAGTLATFYVNGVSVGTSSTNIPTGTSRGLGFGARIIKSAGTNNRQQFIDYIEVKSLFTSAR